MHVLARDIPGGVVRHDYSFPARELGGEYSGSLSEGTGGKDQGLRVTGEGQGGGQRLADAVSAGERLTDSGMV